MNDSCIEFWNATAESYQTTTRIGTDDFHYGPLLPGERTMRLFLERCRPGMSALELGCGAGQNSIFLAANGLRCVAMDGAPAQVEAGRALAESSGVDVEFLVRDLNLFDGSGSEFAAAFDWVHSVFTLPFLHDGQAFIAAAARCLKPGGTLILATAHPLFNGDWVEMDNGEIGVFVEDYFEPRIDQRETADGAHAVSRPVPVATVCEWCSAAGLTLERVLEPRPAQIQDWTEDEIRARVPYDSDGWRELYDIMQRIPVALVVVARRQER